MKAKDLAKEPPRSPHQRLHDYVILARTLDKCRASLNNTLGDYHFDCPLDNMLFRFKGISGDDFREKVKSGAGDEEVGQWLDENGLVQTPGAIAGWSRSLDAYRPYEDPEKRQWFIEQCKPLGLNPRETTLFGFLDADDKAAFPNSAQAAHDAGTWDLPMVETAPDKTYSSLRPTFHQGS